MALSKFKVEISKQWDVLGPFPIHAREQNHLSPSFPLNLSEPIDFEKKWPSSYADGGSVGWNTTSMTDEGDLQVSFPDIRWKYLRSFEGWAALQHHAILRTTFKVAALPHTAPGSFFTVLPKENFSDVTPKWYAGNIYDLPRSLPQLVELPPSQTGEYQLFVSGDYEIRLFGDPIIEGSDIPVQRIKVEIEPEEAVDTPSIREPSLDVICDFVNGHAFGNSIGIGLRSQGSCITVEDAYTNPSSGALGVELREPIKLAPGQARIVPLVLLQHSSFHHPQLEVTLKVTAETPTDAQTSEEVVVSLPLRQLPIWPHTGKRTAISASYLFAGSNPTIFTTLPPSSPAGNGGGKAPILALHGAGVDIVDLHRDFWADAMPKNEETWIIMPTGRTSWGLDWHGPSAQEAWASVPALSDILHANSDWKGQAFPRDTGVVLIGHSNGGQGVWHLATHFPDRVVAAVPAAAYIKSQAYVPLIQSRSAHYIDPMLRAILETSLTPDDNDLHLSNIAHIPLLAVHGGADENVPSWHSRELVSVLDTLSPRGNRSFKEDPGQGHFYNSVLSNPTIQEFVDSHTKFNPEAVGPESFTLTVSNPSENGPLRGLRIQSLIVPGRLGVLSVSQSGDGLVVVSSTNVEHFFVEDGEFLAGVERLTIDQDTFSAAQLVTKPAGFSLDNGHWTVPSALDKGVRPPPTRLQSILSAKDTIRILYDTDIAFSVARRLAHDLLTYHRLDTDLLSSSSPRTDQSTVVIGTLDSPQIRSLLAKGLTSFHLNLDALYIGDKAVDLSSGKSCAFLHPSSTEGGVQLVIIYSDEASLERAARLFPIRTGVAAPDWLYLSPRMDTVGAAGIIGAGVWSSTWELQPESSWFSGR